MRPAATIERPRIARASPARAATGAVLCLLAAACSDTPLYSSLGEQQANEVEAALLSAGIGARKRAADGEASWAVEVPKADVPRAMAVLRAQGLPRSTRSSLGEVFEKKGFVSSPMEERARYLFALSEEMSQTLMQIDGVVSARVHIALPERDLLSDTEESASASVVIIHEPAAELGSRETDIKAIVTDGIEGLDDVNRVTVKFFERGLPLSPSADETVVAQGGLRLAGIGPGALLLSLGSAAALALLGLRQWLRARGARPSKVEV